VKPGVGEKVSAGQFAQEFALVHVVFEGLVAVDEDDGDFVGKSTAQFVVAFDVNFPPGKAAAAMQFGQRLLDDLTEVAALAGVDDDFTRLRHGRSLAGFCGAEKHSAIRVVGYFEF
jgi:hypothetical protein